MQNVDIYVNIYGITIVNDNNDNYDNHYVDTHIS